MNKDFLAVLALRLRYLRCKLRMTQESIAEKCRISSRQVQRIELGQCIPKISYLCYFSRCCGISLAALLDVERCNSEFPTPVEYNGVDYFTWQLEHLNSYIKFEMCEVYRHGLKSFDEMVDGDQSWDSPWLLRSINGISVFLSLQTKTDPAMETDSESLNLVSQSIVESLIKFLNEPDIKYFYTVHHQTLSFNYLEKQCDSDFYIRSICRSIKSVKHIAEATTTLRLAEYKSNHEPLPEL